MLKKIFYFGVGLASLLYENFDRLARAGEEKYSELAGANHQEEIIEVKTAVVVEAEAPASTPVVEKHEQDDLTVINGIGPTFAARLRGAGITTYAALAGLTEEQVREITHVAEWQANPSEWISSAAAMA